MRKESLIILWSTLGIVFIAYLFLTLKLIWEIYREKKWIKSLGKSQLLELEDLLDSCLKSAQIDFDNTVSIDSLIIQQGYTIKKKLIMPFSEAYTTKKPKCDVYIRSSLTNDRRHFALAHELMHIIYKSEELEEKSLSRDIHRILKSRAESEQIRDYMAASLILRKDSFWNEIIRAHYYEISPKERKAFVFQSAEKYNVEPSMVFRRISELGIIMRTQ